MDGGRAGAQIYVGRQAGRQGQPASNPCLGCKLSWTAALTYLSYLCYLLVCIICCLLVSAVSVFCCLHVLLFVALFICLLVFAIAVSCLFA